MDNQKSVHTNGYLNLNGIPYLVSEYFDNVSLQQIDTSIIKSDLFIDQSDSMRAIVDISINDIGAKSSDGSLNLIGNTTKKADILTLIRNNFQLLDHQLPCLKPGIVLRVHYQIEDKRTGHVLRSTQEEFRIRDRNLFLVPNRDNLEDNGLVVNFTDSIVSTMSQFTHGIDTMMLRITNIYMYYEFIKPSPLKPRVSRTLINNPKDLEYFYGCDVDFYKLHQKLQNHHTFDGIHSDSLIPPTWSFFNRFYHYDLESNNMILHEQEISDRRNVLVPVACGTVNVNRSFLINPGHRIIFKVSVWKNDLILVNDSSLIAETLKIPNRFDHPPDINIPENKTTKTDYEQNSVINQLTQAVKALTEMIKKAHPGEDTNTPQIPSLPEKPPVPPKPPGATAEMIELLLKKIADLQKEVEALKASQENNSGDTGNQDSGSQDNTGGTTGPGSTNTGVPGQQPPEGSSNDGTTGETLPGTGQPPQTPPGESGDSNQVGGDGSHTDGP